MLSINREGIISTKQCIAKQEAKVWLDTNGLSWLLKATMECDSIIVYKPASKPLSKILRYPDNKAVILTE